jgi:hypothetical protein
MKQDFLLSPATYLAAQISANYTFNLLTENAICIKENKTAKTATKPQETIREEVEKVCNPKQKIKKFPSHFLPFLSISPALLIPLNASAADITFLLVSISPDEHSMGSISALLDL